MRRALIIAAAFFLLALLLNFPARWIKPLLPRTVQCEQLDGSLWSGSCTSLTAGVSPLGDLNWDLHPLELLRARLGLKVNLTNDGSYLRGDLAFGFGGAVHGHNVTLDLPLTSALVSSLPAGAHARLQGNLTSFEWTGKYVADLLGDLAVQDYTGGGGQNYGSYQVLFAPGTQTVAATPTGVVHDTGGPLALDATLQLTHDPGYVVQGQVAARPSASADVAQGLQYLGTADANGRRPFSLQGTF